MTDLSIKLLIVEDNPVDWQEFEKVSEKSSLHLKLFSEKSISQARKRLAVERFDVVLSDYFLSDGICLDLMGESDGIPLIVMISEGDEEAALVSCKSGAFDYLIKDTRGNFMKFLALDIRKAIEKKNQQEELKKYKSQLENIVEERTIELIDMYSKLQQSETNFRNVFNSSSEGIVILDYNLNLIEANAAILNKVGVTKDFLARQDLRSYISSEYWKTVTEHIENVRKGVPVAIMEIEVICPTRGLIIPFEISSVAFVFNQKNVILNFMHDITEKRNHARRLIEAIIKTEEEERKRIARDLHDEIGPLISALKIFTTSFIETTSEEKKNKVAGQLGDIVRDVIDSVKTISNDMSPHVLVNFGLHAAITNFIDLFSRTIEIKLTSNIRQIRFPDTVESLIYRIMKELINNTVKHARASEVLIDINYTGNLLSCRFRDNGIGFDWNEQTEAPAKGMGINNIITRIRSMGGNFKAFAEAEKGFEINFGLQTETKQ